MDNSNSASESTAIDASASKDFLSDNQLLRYSRQIMLPQWDFVGQLSLENSRVLVIGVGGLGSPASLYLAAAGVGHLVLVDDDDVELSNLQRQIAHTESQLGVNKAVSGKRAVLARNTEIKATSISHRLDADQLHRQVQQADVVLDCSDNLSTRLAVNQACVQWQTPLVSAAAIGFSGQLSVYDARQPQSPCYRCLYDESLETAMNCSENGVFAPLVGVLGAAQAVEALKVISGVGSPVVGQLQLYDALNGEWRSLKIKPLTSCPVCSNSGCS